MDQGLKEKPGTSVASPIDWVARARAIAPEIESAGSRTESERAVPLDIMDRIHEAGLFRMLLPRSIGGGEGTPLDFMEVMEVVASADASTAWCLGQGLGCSLVAGFLDPAITREIFGDAKAVMAWGPTNSTAKATKVDGGYKVSGKWRFASGSRRATWIGGHCLVVQPDGSPVLNKAGKPISRTMLFPIGKAKMTDVWDVIGLRGTGSDDYEVQDLFVPEAYTSWRDSEPDRRERGPLYSIPLLTAYGMGFAGIALGIGRAMLEHFKVVAEKKVAGGANAPLRENAVIQSGVGQCEGKLRSSRAFLVEMIGKTWESACRGEPYPMEQRALLRIAITGAMNQAREVADWAYQAAGTNAIFEKGPFERRFRDMHTVAQQGQAHLSNFEFAGKALLGIDPGHRV
ncbi:MAG TPA: acyl-CoA dehydrogenase family protein [Alphaproteobacteria bacterium]|jgi:alkylation response protein AidB-like acyl-CoA dehydrogenase|nr:acyl-CoA dehydrogenase family protein [Alphaproteobacteria bacterium]